MPSATQRDINRLEDLRRRAFDVGLDEKRSDRELIRMLDEKLADLYARRVAESQSN